VRFRVESYALTRSAGKIEQRVVVPSMIGAKFGRHIPSRLLTRGAIIFYRVWRLPAPVSPLAPSCLRVIAAAVAEDNGER